MTAENVRDLVCMSLAGPVLRHSSPTAKLLSGTDQVNQKLRASLQAAITDASVCALCDSSRSRANAQPQATRVTRGLKPSSEKLLE